MQRVKKYGNSTINPVRIFKRKDIFSSLSADKIYLNLSGDCKKKNHSFARECIRFSTRKRSGLYVLFRINHTLKSNGLAIFYYHMIGPGATEFGRTPFKFCKRTVKKADAKYLFMISSSYSWKSILLSKIPGLTWPRAILKSPYKFERCKENLSTDYASRLH